MKKTIISTIIILITLILIALVFDWGRREVKAPEIDLNASTTENILQNSTSTLNMPIVVNNIKDNQEVSSPIKIEGKARGNWFFEASFPIQLVDASGNIISSTIATAQSDWMTTDFVNFTATLEYNKASSAGPALIVLSKDNPSDNPDFDQSIFVPVVLK
ncbi:MAG: Gmad2 immunoglobulin-like domain-containing protein [bacterium]